MTAHDKNYLYYDFVFEKRYGANYTEFTRHSLKAIDELGNNKLRILDFGCGTGRLAIPLAQKGHFVFGVDKCEGMLEVLRKKASEAGLDIPTANTLSQVNVFDFDLALSVFTVNNYISDSEELKSTFQSVYDRLKSGGLFLFDLSKQKLYENAFLSKNGVIQNKHENDFYDYVKIFFHMNLEHCDYTEKTSGILHTGETFKYEENFILRFWSPSFVKDLLTEIGFVDTCKQFNIAFDADYFLFKKP